MKHNIRRTLALFIALLLAVPTITFAEEPSGGIIVLENVLSDESEVAIPDLDPEVVELEDVPLELPDLSDDLSMGELPQADAGEPAQDVVVTWSFIVNGERFATQEVRDGEPILRPEDPAAPDGQAFDGWELEDGARLFVDADGDGTIDPVIAHADSLCPEVYAYARFVEVEAADEGTADGEASSGPDAVEPASPEALPLGDADGDAEAPAGEGEEEPAYSQEPFSDVPDDGVAEATEDETLFPEETVTEGVAEAPADEAPEETVTDDGEESPADEALSPEETVTEGSAEAPADEQLSLEETATDGVAEATEDETLLPEETVTDGEAEAPADEAPEETVTDDGEESPADEALSPEETVTEGSAEAPADEQLPLEETATDGGTEAPADEALLLEERVTDGVAEAPADEAPEETVTDDGEESPADEALSPEETVTEDSAEAPTDEQLSLEEMTTDGGTEAPADEALLLEEMVIDGEAEAVDIPGETTAEPEAADGESLSANLIPFEQSQTVSGVTVTVSAAPGVFPENARLSVTKAPSYKRRQADAAVEDVRDEDQNVAVSYTFDIKVIDPVTKEALQPAEGQSVGVSFALAEVADDNLTTSIYHLTRDEATGALVAQSLDVTTGTTSETGEATTATVETEGFSLYTVEFTYNDLQYVMQGDTSVALSAILSAVGLTGEAEAVSVSDDGLFSASCETGEWIVTAHQPFSTTEWMRVSIGGTAYEIVVTDAAGEIKTYDQLKTALSNGGDYYLNSNITFTGDALEVKRPVTLDLQGYSITRNLSGAVVSGYVIDVSKGDLTLNDTGGGGKITGGNSTDNYAGAVYIHNGHTFTMNGGTISGNKSSGPCVQIADYCTFNMNGGTISGNTVSSVVSFALRGVFNMNGGTISDNTSTDIGGVSVNRRGAVFNMNGGTISGNTGATGSVYVSQGIFTMTGGTISGNTGSYYAGGVDMDVGTFTMTGGTISGNTGPYGGVYIHGGDFTMTGGSIMRNIATDNGGGVYVKSGNLNISGASVISRNYKGTAENNVYLPSGRKITVDPTNMLTAANIGVTMQSPGVFTSGYGAKNSILAPSTFFFSDDSGKEVAANGSGDSMEAKLVDASGGGTGPTTTFTLTYNGNGGSGAMADSRSPYAAGATVAVLANSFTAPAGKQFRNWNTAANGSGMAFAPKDTFAITANTTLYAQWTDIPATTPNITKQPASVTKTYGDGNKTLSVTAAATGHALSYQWYCDGAAVSGATASTYSIAAKLPAGEHTFFCKVTAKRSDNNQSSTVDSASAKVTVGRKSLSITGTMVANKVYDGTTLATLTNPGSITGALAGDDVGVVAGTVAFTNSNAGDGKTVTCANFRLTGADAGNYALSAQPSGVKASIAKRPVTVVGLTAADKVYDGNASATIVGTPTLNGLVGNDVVTAVASGSATFADKSAGAGKAVTLPTYILNGANAGNYTLPAQPAAVQASITPKPVTITGLAVEAKTYDGTTVATATGGAVSGAVSGDAVRIQPGVALFSDASAGTGKTVVFAGYSLIGSDAGNYSLTAQPANATGTINPITAALAWTGAAFTYDGTAHCPAARVSNIVPGDACDVTVTGEQTNASGEPYTATATALSNPNYALPDQKTCVFTIGKAAVTITADDKSSRYGVPLQTLTWSVSGGYVPGDALDVSASIDNPSGTNPLAVGEYEIVLTCKGDNYDITPVKGKYTVTAGAMTVSASGYDGVYDGEAHSITVEHTPGTTVYYSESPLDGTNYDPGVNPASGTVNLTYKDAGTHTVYYYVAGSNFEAVSGSKTVNIGKRPITVTAEYATKTYGDSDPALTPVILNGSLAAGDDWKGALSRTDGEDAGSYSITRGTLSVSDNYDMTFINGLLTVTPKGVTITGLAVDAKTYDGTMIATATGGTVSGTKPGDDVSIIPGSARFEDSSAGSGKTVTFSGYSLTGAKAGNYYLSAQPAAVQATIGRRKVSIVGVSAMDKVYDGTDVATAVGGFIYGAVYGDTVTFNKGTARFADKNAGKGKTVSFSGYSLDAASQGNYELAGQPEPTSASIAPKTLSITADSATKVYDGTALTKESYTNTELAAGDSIESVTINGSQTVRGTSSNTPSAAVIKDGSGTDVTANYDITYEQGSLTVTPKPMTITADSATKVYDGTALTKDSYTNTDLAAGDSIESVTINGSQTVSGTSPNTPSAAVIKNGSDTDVTASYDITYEQGSLTVEPKEVSVKADDKVSGYGNPILPLTWTTAGLVEGEVLGVTAYTRAYETPDVGEYDIVLTVQKNPNYEITTENGKYTVTSTRSVPVTVSGFSGAYDGQPHGAVVTANVLDAEVYYGKEKLDETNYKTTGTKDSPTFKDAGKNTVYFYVSHKNYGNQAGQAEVNIEPKKLIVIADAQFKTYGDADPELTYSASGLLEGDTLTGKLKRVEGENAGEYAIEQNTLDAGSNYILNYREAKLTIRKKALAISAQDKTKTSGEPDPELTYSVKGLLEGDAVTGKLEREPGEKEGVYAIKQGTVTAGDNYSVLYIGASLAICGENQVTAQAVIDAILALPKSVTPSDKEAVTAARAAYDALTDAQKALVPAEILKKLTDAEAQCERIDIARCDIIAKDRIYTGKALAAKVTVMYGKTKLKEGRDYTLSYKAPKAYQKVRVVVKGKGNFKGTTKVYFKVIPKGTALSKVTGGKKRIDVKWKKRGGVTGYQIEYSLRKDFTSSRNLEINGADTVSQTLKDLKPGKKYYVRIRTFVKHNKRIFFSAWSAAKAVRTKSA